MKNIIKISLVAFLIIPNFYGKAQTITDGIFMSKGSLYGSALYSNDSWNKFWEGTALKENKNIGTLMTQSINVTINYGIADKFNALVSLPYIATSPSAGVSQGMSGIQDLSLGLKYRFIQIKNLSLIGVIGGSIPTNNYVTDYMPFAIGSQSKNAYARGILYYTFPKNLALTLNGSYINRSNIKIDRAMFYTGDKAIFSNEVALPDVVNIGAKFGYNSFRWQLEGTFENQTMGETVGGIVDIRLNDVPLINSQFNFTRIGALGTYRITKLKDLQVIGSVNKIITGRNVGESLTFSLGISQFISIRKNKDKSVVFGPICHPGGINHEGTEKNNFKGK
jgi:hypothetical protein